MVSALSNQKGITGGQALPRPTQSKKRKMGSVLARWEEQDDFAEQTALRVGVKLREHAQMPVQGTALSAGFDVFCPVETAVPPQTRVAIDTGVALEIPRFLYVQIHGRSSMDKKGIYTFPGVVDSDYTGHLIISLRNMTSNTIVIERGVRFAQFVFLPLARPLLQVAIEIEETERGDGGFGSTGEKEVVSKFQKTERGDGGTGSM